MLYAIVDIETTGSFAAGNGITEIAIVIHDGKQVLNFYETLVNPKENIPLFIQSLTGITNQMVANAPTFDEVAGQVYELLQDKIFVAHNVNFDYSFVKLHLKNAGYEYDAKKLCTVRLSRKILPGLNGYSLSKLTRQLNINLTNHHRAGGDALATAEIFSLLLEKDKENAIGAMLKGRNKEQYLPPHLPAEDIDKLPSTPGVYYFYDSKGRVIYVGKAVNIVKRVTSHFSNNKPGKQKQDFLREIYRISYKECATELMAHILESTEIRRLWPVHNRSQRGYLPKFGLYTYLDQQGYKRFAVEKNKFVYKAIYTFNSLAEGQHRLWDLTREFELCPRLCGLAKISDVVTGDANDYNKKVDAALDWLEKHLPTFVLVDKGIRNDEQSCILVKKGNFYGMGYISQEHYLNNIDLLEKELQPLQDNDYIRNLIYRHAAENPQKCVNY